jgi:hypothetical protein
MGALKQENYTLKNASVFNSIELQHLAQKVFAEAIEKANKEKINDAMDLAQEALIYANMCQSQLKVNIHKFLGFINFDLGKFNNARIHCYHAIQSLNIKNKNYLEDKNYFEKMMRLIEEQMHTNKMKIIN